MDHTPKQTMNVRAVFHFLAICDSRRSTVKLSGRRCAERAAATSKALNFLRVQLQCSSAIAPHVLNGDGVLSLAGQGWLQYDKLNQR